MGETASERKPSGGIDALLAEIAHAPRVDLPSTMLGTNVGRYRLDEALGEGGMGIVYRAHDTALGRSVALKLVAPSHAADPELRARLAREARAAAALSHPNIVAVHDVGEHQGRPFLVMEWLQGVTLAEKLARSPLGVGDSVALARGLADALAAMH